jgi:hypothetical protein
VNHARSRLGQWDILVFLALAAGAAAATFIGLSRPARVVLGLPVIVLGQGYVAQAALFADAELDPGFRVMLMLALSLCLGVLGVLAVYAVGAPIDQHSVAIMEVVVMAGFAIPAVARRRRGRASLPAWLRRSRAALPAIASAALVVAVIAVGIVLLSRPIANPAVDGYVDLGAVRSAAGEVEVDIRNEQPVAGTFTLSATGSVTGAWQHTVMLGPGQAWQASTRLAGPSLQTVVVRLTGEIRGRPINRELLLRG